jgi:hypothetical protein
MMGIGRAAYTANFTNAHALTHSVGRVKELSHAFSEMADQDPRNIKQQIDYCPSDRFHNQFPWPAKG